MDNFFQVFDEWKSPYNELKCRVKRVELVLSVNTDSLTKRKCTQVLGRPIYETVALLQVPHNTQVSPL